VLHKNVSSRKTDTLKQPDDTSLYLEQQKSHRQVLFWVSPTALRKKEILVLLCQPITKKG
jgi:hypothetical protein